MENKSIYQLLISTTPNQEIAHKIAQSLLEKHLAACINMLPNIQSVFEWKGEIVTDSEVLLLIKTRRECYPEIEKIFQHSHPYEVPELIALPIEGGLPAYLNWLDEVCH
jgi:periplasmic divalent cation tolerance protein